MIPFIRLQELRRMADAMSSDMPMSSSMLNHLIAEITAEGPVYRLLGNHPDAEEPLYFVRALAGVRLLVLTGQAPQLEAHLKGLTSNLGKPEYNELTWELFKQVLLSHPGEILAGMSRPVQQHHPRRAAALLQGLGMLGRERVRLLEIGACAGLNLLLDRYRWFGPDWEWGDAQSPVRLTASGPTPAPFTIVDRAGCDVDPRDPADPFDAMILRSFIPHERDVEQIELDDAIEVAAESRLRVDAANAVEWLKIQLETAKDQADVTTVVWHSQVWWYLTAQDHSDIDEILTATSRRHPIARIAYEPDRWASAPRLQLHIYS
ncbi:DUF2332 domain-containing protein [Streptomyces sp. IB201691-2A2]|uniref:DUF2332 domain-containing protein n=1 Tax=Streptomyces sp. IB201691-2A2 TaxID=2561920 RepID=UPI00117DF93B|nr:DUF2332 domain-containing protein [Streptomyces sp. IB201691-2A2]TRO55450.1 DUF2332 domain-containing protein [Streptomyces sp. IB201691-2A2]